MFKPNHAPSIIYELIEEHGDGTSLCRFFSGKNVLKSRQEALQYFLRLHFEEMENVLLTLYVRHLPTLQRVELINSMTYGSFWELVRGLEKELSFYEKEMLATFIAIINSSNEDSVKIYWPRKQFHHVWKNNVYHFMIAADYWIFTKGRKKEVFLPY